MPVLPVFRRVYRPPASGASTIGPQSTLHLASPPAATHIFVASTPSGSARAVAFSEGQHVTRMSFASHPYLLGFEQLDRLLERNAKNGEGYPPFNIEQRGDNAWRISLAVAGFSEDDLQVTVEDRQLVIRGRQAEDPESERVFLHRGIATRQFQRSFVLADGVEVGGAAMENGLLHIDLQRSAPEAIVKTIHINGGG
jgi:HSP20 family molecular chaperone IbpA